MAKTSGIPARLACAAAALAFVSAAAAQQIVEYPLPTANAAPRSIVEGPDGNFWFTESDAGKIGRITPGGVITEYPLPIPGAEPWRIAAGPDGALWFTEMLGNRIGRIATSGAIEEFEVPTARSLPLGIAAGPDGALWFTEREANRIGRITTSGAILEFPLDAHTGPNGIVAGADGALWFAEQYAGRAGRLTTAGVWSETDVLPAPGYPDGIAHGSDGSVWVTTAPGSGGSAVSIPASGPIVAHPITDYTPGDPAVDASGSVWVATSDGTIAKLDTRNRITVFPVPSPGAYPTGVAIAADGTVWFTESQGNRIGRLDPGAPSSCVAPAAPVLSVDGAVAATVPPGGTFTLSWTGTVGTGGRYAVLESASGGLGWTTVKTTSTTSVTLAASEQDSGATLLFEVRATNECGASDASSAPSNEVSVAVSGAPPPPPPPPPPSGCTGAGGRPCVTPLSPPSPAIVEPPPRSTEGV